MEKQKSYKKLKGTKSWFFEKIYKIDKALVRLTKKKEKDIKDRNY